MRFGTFGPMARYAEDLELILLPIGLQILAPWQEYTALSVAKFLEYHFEGWQMAMLPVSWALIGFIVR